MTLTRIVVTDDSIRPTVFARWARRSLIVCSSIPVRWASRAVEENFVRPALSAFSLPTVPLATAVVNLRMKSRMTRLTTMAPMMMTVIFSGAPRRNDAQSKSLAV